MEKARNCLDKSPQDCACAVPLLEKALTYYSGYVEALVPLGYCYYAVGRYEDALKTAKAASKLQRREPLALLTQAMAYEKLRKVPEAVVAYRAALKAKKHDLNAGLGLARMLKKSGDIQGAIAAFEDVVASRKRYLPAVLQLAECYKEVRQQKKAEKVLRAYLKENPKHSGVLMSLASLYRDLGRFNDAIKALQAVLGENYNQPVIHLSLAQTYIAAGKTEEATVHLQIATEFDPNYIDAKMTLATLYANGGNPEDALPLLDHVLSRGDSEYLQAAYETKVKVLAQLHRQVEAEEVAEAAMAKYPAHFRFMELVARKKLREGAYEQALELAQKLTGKIEKDKVGWTKPAVAAAWSLRAAIELVSGKFPEAEKSALAALAADPKDVDAMVIMARVGAAEKNFDKTKEWVDKVVARKPKRPEVLNNLAVLLLDSKAEDAVVLLEKARKLLPKSPSIRNNIAVAAARIGDGERGIKLLEEVVAERPDDPVFQCNLALLITDPKRDVEALALLEKSVANGATETGCYQRLGALYAKQGDLKKAEEALRKALELDPSYAPLKTFILYNLGTILLRNPRKLGEARSLLSDAEKLDDQIPEIYNNLGYLNFKADRLQQARNNFRQAAALRSNERVFLANQVAAGELNVDLTKISGRSALEEQMGENLRIKGLKAMEGGDWEAALSHLRQAKEAGLHSALLENALGVCHARLGQSEQAQDAFMRAIEVAPDSPDPLLNIALLVDLKLGQTSDSIKYYDRYLSLEQDPKVARYVNLQKRLLGIEGF